MNEGMINLTSPVLQVVRIVKPTKAKVLKDVKVGDTLVLQVAVVAVGSSRGRTYAPEIAIYNTRTGEATHKTFNQIEKVLASFELLELK